MIPFGFFERIKLKPSRRFKVAILEDLIALTFSRQNLAIDREDPISDDDLIARKGYNALDVIEFRGIRTYENRDISTRGLRKLDELVRCEWNPYPVA